MLRKDPERYGGVAQALHWLTAGLIFVMIPLGFYMEGLPLGQFKFDLYQVHKSLGLTVLLLVLARLIWRARHPAPPLPVGMPGWERVAARVTHVALYGLLIAQPLIGFLHSNAANFPVVFWGLVPLPALIGANEALADSLISAHAVVGFALTLLVVMHIAAALRHHFVKRDAVLLRMLPRST
jgi:cytochrome b561